MVLTTVLCQDIITNLFLFFLIFFGTSELILDDILNDPFRIKLHTNFTLSKSDRFSSQIQYDNLTPSHLFKNDYQLVIDECKFLYV